MSLSLPNYIEEETERETHDDFYGWGMCLHFELQEALKIKSKG
jgi:hypothetical protein